jgi:hypothetical protein
MRTPSLRHAILLALVLGLIGAGPPGQHGPGTVGEFTALSYNVAGLPEAIGGEEPGRHSPKISPLLNDYDLVLLQESWKDDVHELGQQQPAPAELLGQWPLPFYHHVVVADADHPYQSTPADHPYGTDLRRAPNGPTLVADGLNRLSRFPFRPIDLDEDGELTRGLSSWPGGSGYEDTIEVTRRMWETCHGDLAMVAAEEALHLLGVYEALEPTGLTGQRDGLIDGGAADCLAQKGFSLARTELAPGVEVDVYNLHAGASGHERDRVARAEDFAQLAEFIAEHSEGRAVLLGGDVNLRVDHDNPGRAEFDEIVWEGFQATTGVTDVCAVLDCGDDAFVHDKFAFRSGGGVQLTPHNHRFERERFQNDDGEPLSDHDPLAVDFRWRAVGGSAGR